MTQPGPNRAKQLFNEALEKSGMERLRFVDSVCGTDAELRAELESLLAAHDRAGHFMAGTGGAADAAARVVAHDERDEPIEQPGSRIGPYKLLEVIGEGGFGVVYMAEQIDPIRRRVALKIIKPGMDTRQVIARFEAERQALALMDHPNIAKVFDAGATDSGRPFFVMELVRGVPITEYCDANRLKTRDRLALFVDVCKAVHHAHEKGVVHRDIKPSNVMVTLHDGTAVPKVIDFGIAKATNQPLTEKTLFTAFGQFLGTPTYMSPEQAAFGGLEIDRRCDVYSLGVLLYELLTGTTPFEQAVLRERAFVEMMRVIREDDPPTPSARLNTLGARLAAVASRRDVEPHALLKLLRGDLDWIVMRAIDKDRTRRYESASEFAIDVGRYFRHEPVSARKPGVLYRASKFAKRRRGPLLAAVGMLVAVVLGAAATQGFRKRAAVSGSPATRLVFDWLRDSGSVIESRDGRYGMRYSLSRRAYELTDAASGKLRRLIPAAPEFDGLLSGLNDLAPDGRALAIVSGMGRSWGSSGRAAKDSGHTDLRLFTAGGDEQGRLLKRWGTEVNRVEVFGWSPDRRRLWLWIMNADRTAAISTIDLKSGSITSIKTLAFRTHTQAPSLSPDGRFVTYHDGARGQAPDVFITSTDGRQDVRVEHPARDALPVFTPDGSGVVLKSDRKGGDLWFLPVIEGRPTGDARAVWDDIGPYGMAFGFTGNGSLLYYFAGSGWELYTADLNLRNGTVGPPTLIAPQQDEMNNAPAYSPDGRYLAHLRGSGRRLVLREVSTGNEREFPLQGSLSGAPSIDFCPDGASLIIAGFQAASSGVVVLKVNLERGGAQRIPVAAASGSSVLCVQHNDLLYTAVAGPGLPARIIRRSAATEAETIVFEIPARHLEFARSPDGTRIAILPQGESRWWHAFPFFIVPTGGGAIRKLNGPWGAVHGFSWLPDASGLLVARQVPTDSGNVTNPEVALWSVPLNGAPPKVHGSMRLPSHAQSYYGSWHYGVDPTGSHLVFERHAGFTSQVWAIDNLEAFIKSGALLTVRQFRHF
jgi:serine/threonine protein kinase/dipeptidyl aminopeptidase/acylaminoacyl peptidase